MAECDTSISLHWGHRHLYWSWSRPIQWLELLIPWLSWLVLWHSWDGLQFWRSLRDWICRLNSGTEYGTDLTECGGVCVRALISLAPYFCGEDRPSSCGHTCCSAMLVQCIKPRTCGSTMLVQCIKPRTCGPTMLVPQPRGEVRKHNVGGLRTLHKEGKCGEKRQTLARGWRSSLHARSWQLRDWMLQNALC